jgi:putative membrane protein
MEPGPDTLVARFNPLIRPYLVLRVGFVLLVTIVLAPLAVLWFCGVGQWWARHYFDKLTCELGETSVRFSKGILVSVEKTIPLENIQDVTFIEGPLLKHFELSILKFETAGQGRGDANAMQLVGIVDAAAFRREFLARREALKRRASAPPADAQLEVLRSIDARLGEIATLLRR